MNDPDEFRNRISFATETLPAAEVEYWAKKYDVDPQVVIDAYVEIPLRNADSRPAKRGHLRAGNRSSLDR